MPPPTKQSRLPSGSPKTRPFTFPVPASPPGMAKGPPGTAKSPPRTAKSPPGTAKSPPGTAEEPCAYGEDPAASGDATEPEPYLAPHDPNTGAQTVPFRGPFEPHPAQPKLSDLTVTDLLPAEMTSTGVDPVGVELAASDWPPRNWRCQTSPVRDWGRQTSPIRTRTGVGQRRRPGEAPEDQGTLPDRRGHRGRQRWQALRRAYAATARADQRLLQGDRDRQRQEPGAPAGPARPRRTSRLDHIGRRSPAHDGGVEGAAPLPGRHDQHCRHCGELPRAIASSRAGPVSCIHRPSPTLPFRDRLRLLGRRRFWRRVFHGTG